MSLVATELISLALLLLKRQRVYSEDLGTSGAKRMGDHNEIETQDTDVNFLKIY